MPVETEKGHQMEMERFKLLLSGQEPTLDDFAFFVELAESAETNVLWSLLVDNPKMSVILKNTINNVLRDKIPRQKQDASINAIIKKLME